jgi:DHA1 family multidrug resistance protein-like MFS transporter
MNKGNNRNLIFISLSQLGMAFSYNFVMVFLPFSIFKISPYSYQETLIWVGLIMAAPSIVAAVTSTFWGSLTSRFSPKSLYLRGLLSHAVLFLWMGFTTNLYVLLLLRLLQGVLGGTSTVGLIIVSSSSSKERISEDIGFFQTAFTLGQLIGPPIGALAAAVFGYKGAFVSASVVLFATAALCYLNVTEVPHQPKQERFFGPSTINRRTIIGWMLCFTATVQLMFLPSVLPNVFENFNIERVIALKWAGIVVMLYTATAMMGTYFWSKLSVRIRRDKMILTLIIFGTFFQLLLSISQGIVDFVLIRMAQTGLIAATIPLIISIFATELRGGVIGFLNSARFAGNAVGPIIATSVLAFSNLTILYLFISGMTILALSSFKFLFKNVEEHNILIH